jgi:hypothetical protein
MSLFWRNRSPYFNRSLWSFCLHSVFTEYGKTFLLKVVVSHPLKTLKGVKKYGQSGAGMSSRGCTISHLEPESGWTGGKGSIVGVGFCAKPLDPPCLSQRANHDCAYFERRLHLDKCYLPVPCKECMIREVGLGALSSKSDFYIMTSAKDILSDLFLPALNSSTYQSALFGLCHYSFEPFKIALFISEIEALLCPFEKGDCDDYRTWRKADLGIKDTQTQLRNDDLEAIKTKLQNEANMSDTVSKFKKIGNIFRFDD